MGVSLGCCPAVYTQKTFKENCLSYASEENKKRLQQVFSQTTNSEACFILGQWLSSDQKTGKGLIYSDENFYYEGDIIDSKANGNGKIVWPNKVIYQGQIINNKANGYGQIHFIDQEMKLQGRWIDGQPYKNEQLIHIYKGQKSTIVILNIEQQLTKTQSNILNVKIVFEDQKIYEGQVKRKKQGEFKIEGQGKLTFPDGSVYIGDFYEGQMDGYGEYHWAAYGHYYKGQYKKNYRDGKGTYYYSQQNYKSGLWKAGKLYQQII